MADLMIDTTLFAGEDDLKLLDWLRQHLRAHGYQTDEPKQKDGFWGCSVLQQAVPIWMLVAVVSDEGPEYQWGISVDAVLGPLNPANWFKKSEGRQIARQIMSVIIECCKSEKGISNFEVGEEP